MCGGGRWAEKRVNKKATSARAHTCARTSTQINAHAEHTNSPTWAIEARRSPWALKSIEAFLFSSLLESLICFSYSLSLLFNSCILWAGVVRKGHGRNHTKMLWAKLAVGMPTTFFTYPTHGIRHKTTREETTTMDTSELSESTARLARLDDNIRTLRRVSYLFQTPRRS